MMRRQLRLKTRKYSDEAVQAVFGVAAVLLLIVVSGLFVLFASYMEARAYNNVTGKNVSMWDAMWIDLRVVSESKGE